MGNEIYFGYDLLPQEVLEHYGMPRRSGRYPWGSGEDPYHHGASAPGGKQRSNKPKSLSIGERIKRRRAVKASVEKAKAEAAAKQSKEEREKQKKEAIESGDPKRLAPFVRELSDAELKQASDRLRLENEFADRLVASSKYEKTAADKINAKLEKLNNYATTGIRAYNNFAMIANAFRGPDEQLPIVGAKKKDGDGDGEGKKKDKSGKKQTDSGNDASSNQKTKSTESGSQQKSKPTETNPQQEPKPKKEYVLPEALRNEKTTDSKTSETDLQKRWAEEANAAADRAKEAKRSEEVRELANEYAKQIALQEEAARRKSWTDDANKTADRGAEARRSEEVRELANEYARQIAMLEEARRRKNMKFY